MQICRGISLLAFDGISDLSGHCRWSEPSLSKLLQSAVIKRLTITHQPSPKCALAFGRKVSGEIVKGESGKIASKNDQKENGAAGGI